jgi:hypothetical protein
MWSWLASLLGGPFVRGLIAAYRAKLDAANKRDHVAADLAAKEIEADIDARKQATAIQASDGTSINRGENTGNLRVFWQHRTHPCNESVEFRHVIAQKFGGAVVGNFAVLRYEIRRELDVRFGGIHLRRVAES